MEVTQYKKIRIGRRLYRVDARQANKAIRTAAKYAAITTACIILFALAKPLAYEFRGYKAIGGEYALLLLPLLWFAAERTIRDTIKDVKRMRKDTEE